MLAGAAAAGLVVLGVIPIWSAASTLDWTRTPYAKYSRIYTPHQKLGFGVDPAPALRALPHDTAAADSNYRRIHASHTLASLPRAFAERIVAASREVFGGSAWRVVLAAFAAIGLFALGPRGRFALVAALGIWTVLMRVWQRHALRAEAVCVLLRLGLGARDALATLDEIAERGAYHREFARALAGLVSEPKAIVFVRYGAQHDPNLALVENSANAAKERAVQLRRGVRENLAAHADSLSRDLRASTRNCAPIGAPRRAGSKKRKNRSARRNTKQ